MFFVTDDSLRQKWKKNYNWKDVIMVVFMFFVVDDSFCQKCRKCYNGKDGIMVVFVVTLQSHLDWKVTEVVTLLLTIKPIIQ